jgi:hypothetical protein
MSSSGVLRRVTVVRTNVSDEHIGSVIKATRIGKLETPLAVTRNRCRLLVTANVVSSLPILVTLMMEALNSFETSVLTRAPRRNITDDGILHSYGGESLKSYMKDGNLRISKTSTKLGLLFWTFSIIKSGRFTVDTLYFSCRGSVTLSGNGHSIIFLTTTNITKQRIR